MRIIIDEEEVQCTNRLKLVGVSIDKDLAFKDHIIAICSLQERQPMCKSYNETEELIPTNTRLNLFKAPILPH